MDFADLAIFDLQKGVIGAYEPSTEVRERRVLPGRGRSAGVAIPRTQYSPIESVAELLVHAMIRGREVNWHGIKRTTIQKALSTLEDLGFVTRKEHTIAISSKGLMFGQNPDSRQALFTEAAMSMPSFVTFIGILEEHKSKRLSLRQLGLELINNLKTDWRHATAETNAKIMLDWARHLNLAPGVYAHNRRKGKRKTGKDKNTEPALF